MVSKAKQSPQAWAAAILEKHPVIFDTESTGLRDAEIIEASVIDWQGNVLIDTYVRNVRPIPADATRVHGITAEMIQDAPSWREVSEKLAEIFKGRDVIIYNRDYDVLMLYSSDKISGIRHDWEQIANFECAMLPYSEFWGDWNDYRQSYRWQKLTLACEQQGIPEPTQKAHSALGDVFRTLALVEKLAKS